MFRRHIVLIQDSGKEANQSIILRFKADKKQKEKFGKF